MTPDTRTPVSESEATPAPAVPSVEEIEEAKALGKQATDQLASFELDIWGRSVITLYRALTKAEQELAKATLERDEAVKRVEVKDALLADEFKHSAALAERVSQAEARAAAMEAALRQIIKLYDPTSDDDFEAVQMVEIARATLAQSRSDSECDLPAADGGKT